MPSKLDDSSNLQFLYVCLESGPQKRIDFQEVAKEFGLSVPAARMRWRRLQISLGGDKQDSKVTKPKSAALNRKTKRVGKKRGVKEGLEVNWKGAKDGDNDDDDEEEVTGGKVERRRGSKLKKEESDDEEVEELPEPEKEEMDTSHGDMYLDTVRTLILAARALFLVLPSCLFVAFPQVARQNLEFDFERLCSKSMTNINVYCCLVCGKYFQGRGRGSWAYRHAVGENHRVWLNLGTEKVGRRPSICD